MLEIIGVILVVMSLVNAGKFMLPKQEDPCKTHVQHKYKGTPKYQLMKDKCAAQVAEERRKK